MSNITIVERPAHMRFNKKTQTYTVVRGSSYIRRNPSKTAKA